MANEKKISLYLRDDNKKEVEILAKKLKRKRNDVINIAIEEFLQLNKKK